MVLPAKPIAEREALSAFLDSHPFETGFFVKNLQTGNSVERFAGRLICLASIAKIFCLTELYKQKNRDFLELGQKISVSGYGNISLLQAADLMIGQSDNAATCSLIEFLGRDKICRIPSLLGLTSISADILPDKETLYQTLDKRVFGKRLAAAGLPQHGSARDITTCFELLVRGRVISQRISNDLLAFLAKHPKPFTAHYADSYSFLGKGGDLLWTRPPKHYSMMGWGLLLTGANGERIALCVWGEWFPEEMSADQQAEFLEFISDSAITIVR